LIVRWRNVRLGFALCLFCWMAGTALGAAPLVVDGSPSQRFDGYLSVLDDPSGPLDLAAVRRADAAGRFRPIGGDGFSSGYRTGGIWVRFAVRNGADEAQRRWLALENPLLGSCILYLVDSAGAGKTLVSGTVVPVEQRPLATRGILFPLDLAVGEVQTAYLRVGGPTLLASELALWQPAAYAEAESARLNVKAAIVAASVTAVVLFSLLAWRSNGRPALLAVGLGDALLGLSIFLLEGYAAGWLPASDQFWQQRLFGAVLLLGLFCHIVFARAFLDLPNAHPRLARGMTFLASLCLLGAVLQGAVLNLRVLTIMAALTITVAMGILVAIAAWHGARNGRQYILAWGVLLMIIIVRAAGGIFEGPAVVQSNDLPLVGFLVSSLVLGYAMYRDSRLVGAAAESARQRLFNFQRTEQERLVAAVESRTRELSEAKLQAETAGQARLAFLSTVSHELRTPLHTIVGYAQLLRKGGRREADTKLSVIETSGRHLLYLIDEILEFIRGDHHAAALRPEPISLCQLASQLEDTGKLLAATAGNRFVVELAADLPAVVEVDEHKLTQVLTNLIGNACKYTANGTVSVRVERLESLAAETLPDGMECLRFAVDDTGVGIAAEQQARIFEPFSRAPGSEYQPGVGLGLTIARQTVQAMGGDIALESEPGRGSRFFFSLVLPAVRDMLGAEMAATSVRIVGHTGPQRTLLVADDIVENRLFLRDLCSAWGFRVVTAKDGAEALAICRAADIDVACVLVDQFMPVMDGWGLLRALRADVALANLPVVLISAAEPRRPEVFPADVDFDDVFLKPMRHHELAGLLQRRLDLEWILDDAGAGLMTAAEVPAATGKFVLSATQLADFREMLALGRVVAIRRWGEDLAHAQPELHGFAAKVSGLVESVDLGGLKRLLAQAEQDAAGSLT
jgi:signal transduction histidine kinase